MITRRHPNAIDMIHLNCGPGWNFELQKYAVSPASAAIFDVILPFSSIFWKWWENRYADGVFRSLKSDRFSKNDAPSASFFPDFWRSLTDQFRTQTTTLTCDLTCRFWRNPKKPLKMQRTGRNCLILRSLKKNGQKSKVKERKQVLQFWSLSTVYW